MQRIILIYYLFYLNNGDSRLFCSISFLLAYSIILLTILLPGYWWFWSDTGGASVLQVKDDWTKIIYNVCLVGILDKVWLIEENRFGFIFSAFQVHCSELVKYTISAHYYFALSLHECPQYLQSSSRKKKKKAVLLFGNYLSCNLILLILNSSFNSSCH